MLLKFSPAGLYDTATEAWAGTDLNGIQDFFTAVQRYRQAIINYFHDEKIFASRQWFSADQGGRRLGHIPAVLISEKRYQHQCKTGSAGSVSAVHDEYPSLYRNISRFYQK